VKDRKDAQDSEDDRHHPVSGCPNTCAGGRVL
jgi:hypothetical protein